MSFDIQDFNLRHVDTQLAISALRKFLEVMEAQLEEVLRCERVALEAEFPQSGDEEDRDLFSSREADVEDVFEHDLTPAMRYSFIVLMHTVLETRLRAFCSEMQKERSIPLKLGDLRGSPIDQARTYLTKLAALPVGDFPEWQHLRTLQKARDCIVHTYGYVAELSVDRQREVREIAGQNIGVTIDAWGRLALTKAICEQQLSHLDRFFHGLFLAAGWKP